MYALGYTRRIDYESFWNWCFGTWTIREDHRDIAHNIGDPAVRCWTVMRGVRVLGVQLVTCRLHITKSAFRALSDEVKKGTRLDPLKLTRRERQVLTALAIFKDVIASANGKKMYQPRFPKVPIKTSDIPDAGEIK